MSDQPLTVSVFQEFERRMFEQFGAIAARFDGTDLRLDRVDGRLDRIDGRLDGMDRRFDEVDLRLDEVDRRFDRVDRRFDGVDARFDGVDGRFVTFAVRFDALDQRLDGFQQSVDSRFNDAAGQLDALSHRLLRLDEEYVFIKEALKRLEDNSEVLGGKVDRVEVAVRHLDERLSGLERRLDDLVVAEPRYALRSDVQDLKARVERLQDHIDALEKRIEPS
jgi:chromosome segregation ATPase